MTDAPQPRGRPKGTGTTKQRVTLTIDRGLRAWARRQGLNLSHILSEAVASLRAEMERRGDEPQKTGKRNGGE